MELNTRVVSTLQAYNTETTLIQRKDVESKLNRCCFYVVCPLGMLNKVVDTLLNGKLDS